MIAQAVLTPIPLSPRFLLYGAELLVVVLLVIVMITVFRKR
jgi:hypothetical protein